MVDVVGQCLGKRPWQREQSCEQLLDDSDNCDLVCSVKTDRPP
jgi:hypothetical protein